MSSPAWNSSSSPACAKRRTCSSDSRASSGCCCKSSALVTAMLAIIYCAPECAKPRWSSLAVAASLSSAARAQTTRPLPVGEPPTPGVYNPTIGVAGDADASSVEKDAASLGLLAVVVGRLSALRARRRRHRRRPTATASSSPRPCPTCRRSPLGAGVQLLRPPTSFPFPQRAEALARARRRGCTPASPSASSTRTCGPIAARSPPGSTRSTSSLVAAARALARRGAGRARSAVAGGRRLPAAARVGAGDRRAPVPDVDRRDRRRRALRRAARRRRSALPPLARAGAGLDHQGRRRVAPRRQPRRHPRERRPRRGRPRHRPRAPRRLGLRPVRHRLRRDARPRLHARRARLGRSLSRHLERPAPPRAHRFARTSASASWRRFWPGCARPSARARSPASCSSSATSTAAGPPPRSCARRCCGCGAPRSTSTSTAPRPTRAATTSPPPPSASTRIRPAASASSGSPRRRCSSAASPICSACAPTSSRSPSTRARPSSTRAPARRRRRAQQREAYVGDVWAHLLAGIAEARHVDVATARAWIDRGPYTAAEAKAAGLVDELRHGDEVEGAIDERLGRHVALESPPTSPERENDWQRPAVAVLFVEGDIVDGKSATIPILGMKFAGMQTLMSALQRARDDSRVRAIVVRIDSPGGSALASDVLARELERTAQVKPVICSLGDVAASGGYFIAAACSRIYAAPSTLTGSIGIFTGKFDVSGLAAKLGVSARELRARHARRHRLALSPVHRRGARRASCRSCATSTAASSTRWRAGGTSRRPRSTPSAAATSGRATPRSSRGLVDEFGGLMDAIAEAKRRAGLADSERVSLQATPDEPGLLGQFLQLLGIGGGASRRRAPSERRRALTPPRAGPARHPRLAAPRPERRKRASTSTSPTSSRRSSSGIALSTTTSSPVVGCGKRSSAACSACRANGSRSATASHP